MHANIGKGKGNQHFADLLNQLGYRSGDHILLSLNKAAEGGKNTYNHDAGRNGIETKGRPGRADNVYEHSVQQGHHQ